MSSADIAARFACQDLMIQSYRLVDDVLIVLLILFAMPSLSGSELDLLEEN